MKVLVVGSGGREHALCWAIAKSPHCDELYCAPGNAGIDRVAVSVPIAADDIDGIVSFTTAPLRISTILGLLVSASAFIYIIYVVVRTLMYGTDLAGYPSMMAVILFLGGVQLLSLGIIGEYVGRIFLNVNQKPQYLVKEVVNG